MGGRSPLNAPLDQLPGRALAVCQRDSPDGQQLQPNQTVALNVIDVSL